jgi:hypothetical protein
MPVFFAAAIRVDLAGQHIYEGRCVFAGLGRCFMLAGLLLATACRTH